MLSILQQIVTEEIWQKKSHIHRDGALDGI